MNFSSSTSRLEGTTFDDVRMLVEEVVSGAVSTVKESAKEELLTSKGIIS
jgi:hypothetical protein